jgi:hypothetical protein
MPLMAKKRLAIAKDDPSQHPELVLEEALKQ